MILQLRACWGFVFGDKKDGFFHEISVKKALF